MEYRQEKEIRHWYKNIIQFPILFNLLYRFMVWSLDKKNITSFQVWSLSDQMLCSLTTKWDVIVCINKKPIFSSYKLYTKKCALLFCEQCICSAAVWWYITPYITQRCSLLHKYKCIACFVFWICETTVNLNVGNKQT